MSGPPLMGEIAARGSLVSSGPHIHIGRRSHVLGNKALKTMSLWALRQLNCLHHQFSSCIALCQLLLLCGEFAAGEGQQAFKLLRCAFRVVCTAKIFKVFFLARYCSTLEARGAA